MTSPTRREFLGGAFALLSAASIRSPSLGTCCRANVAFGSPNEQPLGKKRPTWAAKTTDRPRPLWEEDSRCSDGALPTCAAEFALALMEPAEGKFEFGWLHRAVEILHKHNIAVILGTPSAAPPPWLSAKYPDIFEVNAQGERLRPGGRRFTCPTNPVYRKLSLAIASQMAKKFSDNPGVIGWQIDNELTLGSAQRCYCNFCQAGFQNWLRTRYSTLDNLNQSWGTVFWSQTYTDFPRFQCRCCLVANPIRGWRSTTIATSPTPILLSRKNSWRCCARCVPRIL